jgi:hypothetical protein
MDSIDRTPVASIQGNGTRGQILAQVTRVAHRTKPRVGVRSPACGAGPCETHPFPPPFASVPLSNAARKLGCWAHSVSARGERRLSCVKDDTS